jgi:hypothetical protein
VRERGERGERERGEREEREERERKEREEREREERERGEREERERRRQTSGSAAAASLCIWSISAGLMVERETRLEGCTFRERQANVFELCDCACLLFR